MADEEGLSTTEVVAKGVCEFTEGKLVQLHFNATRTL